MQPRSDDGWRGRMFRGVSVRLCVCQRAGPAFTNLIVCAVALLSSAWAAAAPTTAFYRGSHPPVRSLAAFDRVVLEPDNASADDLRALTETRVEVFACLRIGDPTQPGWRQ